MHEHDRAAVRAVDLSRRVAARPILIKGGAGTFKVGLPERPKKVTIAEGYECLARFDEK